MLTASRMKTKIENTLFVEAAFKHGLLIVPASENVIRILPPLNVTECEVDLALELLNKTAESLVL